MTTAHELSSGEGFGPLPALAAAFKALGDETRLRIVNLILHRGELCVCELEELLGISQSKASRHVVYLKHAGLLTDRRDGTWVYYRMAPQARSALRPLWNLLGKTLASDERAAADLREAMQAAMADGREAGCAPIAVARASRRRTG